MAEDNTGNRTSTVLVSSAWSVLGAPTGRLLLTVGDLDRLTLSDLEPVSIAEVSTDLLDDHFAMLK